jgi:hypothetical protein
MIKKYSELNLESFLKKNVTRNNSFYSLMLDLIDAGPLDGGCALLAISLKKIFGGQLYGIKATRSRNTPSKIQHVVLKYNNKYYDADGGFSEKEMLTKFEDEEIGILFPVLTPISLSEIPPETPTSPEYVEKIVNFFKKRTKISSLKKQSGKIKEKLTQMWEQQVDPDRVSFEEWLDSVDPEKYLAGYTDVPVKTWDKKYHEVSQPYDLDFNQSFTPETTGQDNGQTVSPLTIVKEQVFP